MHEDFLAPLFRVDAVEIKGQRVAELQLLVVLEQVLLLDPCACFALVAELGFEPLLTCYFVREHAIGQWPVVGRDLVDQQHAG